MKKVIYFLSLIVISLLLNSCAVNQKVNYDNLKMDLFAVKAKSLNLALLDHREVVVDGSRKPSFTGYMRSNVGIAYPISTKTGGNFIDEIAGNITVSLNKFNTKATKMSAEFKQNEVDVKKILLESNSDKKLLIVFSELHTDGFAIQNLHYDFEVSVFDRSNELIAFKRFHDKRKLGGNVAFGAGAYKRYMPEAIVQLFEDVLKEKNILDALNK